MSKKSDLFNAGFDIGYNTTKKYFTNEMAIELRKHIYNEVLSTVNLLSDDEKKEFYQGIDIGIINAILHKLYFNS